MPTSDVHEERCGRGHADCDGQCLGRFYIVDALDIAQQGYPVKITYPEDGVSFGIEATGVIAGGKDNEQAKVRRLGDLKRCRIHRRQQDQLCAGSNGR